MKCILILIFGVLFFSAKPYHNSTPALPLFKSMDSYRQSYIDRGGIVHLKLLPKDFEGNAYISASDCAVSRAARRFFKTKAFVGPDGVCVFYPETISMTSYTIVGGYDYYKFEEGKEKAKQCESQMQPVQEVILTH